MPCVPAAFALCSSPLCRKAPRGESSQGSLSSHCLELAHRAAAPRLLPGLTSALDSVASLSRHLASFHGAGPGCPLSSLAARTPYSEVLTTSGPFLLTRGITSNFWSSQAPFTLWSSLQTHFRKVYVYMDEIYQSEFSSFLIMVTSRKL